MRKQQMGDNKLRLTHFVKFKFSDLCSKNVSRRKTVDKDDVFSLSDQSLLH